MPTQTTPTTKPQRTSRATTKPAIQAAVLSTQDACIYLGISRSTLHRLVQEGRIKRVQLGVRRTGFTHAQLDAFIESASTT